MDKRSIKQGNWFAAISFLLIFALIALSANDAYSRQREANESTQLESVILAETETGETQPEAKEDVTVQP